MNLEGSRLSHIQLLDRESLLFWCNQLDLPQGLANALDSARELVLANQDLSDWISEFHAKTVERGDWHRDWSPVHVDDRVRLTAGDQWSIVYLFAYLTAIPAACCEYERLHVDRQILIDTLWDVKRYALEYFESHGDWGFDAFSWIWRHLSAKLFRIGRLQFMEIPSTDQVRVFRRRSELGNDEVIVFADPNQALDTHGVAWGAGRVQNELPELTNEAWRPVWSETADAWLGNEVLRNGRVKREVTTLSKDQWDCIIEPGTPLLDLHIPSGPGFSAEACEEAMMSAREFFANTFPDSTYPAFFCYSWLLSWELTMLLPDTSNILQLQMKFHLLPTAGTTGWLQRAVFGAEQENMALAPEKTSLQRNLKNWFTMGKPACEMKGLSFIGL